MDYAFQQVFTGAMDYDTAVRRATKNLADMGVRVIGYESGVHTSVEAATRRNIMGGLGLMQEQITQANHDQLGADGWEISAHANSAPDHEPIQGRQYSDKEYERLNNSLVRRIGTLNCGHAAYPIILGVNAPQYTKEQLKRFQEDNEAGITYQGRHYTGYEATQKQRAVERAIRKEKNRILVAEATGDNESLQTAQIRLQRLNQEYRGFSKAAGLPTQRERTMVAGFGRGEAVRATASGTRYEVFSGQLRGTVTRTGVVVSAASPHVFARMSERGVADADISAALTTPLKVGKIRADGSQQFIGSSATAVINTSTGKVVTAWPTSGRKSDKLKGGT